jgi:hypothetical protein
MGGLRRAGPEILVSFISQTENWTGTQIVKKSKEWVPQKKKW